VAFGRTEARRSTTDDASQIVVVYRPWSISPSRATAVWP